MTTRDEEARAQDELVRALEDLTPSPDPDFAADMERRMRDGFGGKERRRVPQFTLLLRSPAMAGAVTSIALALVVATSLLTAEEGPKPQTLESKEIAVREIAQGGEATRSAASGDSVAAAPLPTTSISPVPPTPGDDLAPRERTRRVERAAQLTLAADPDDFGGISDRVFAVVDRQNGLVVRSNLTESKDGHSAGSFELRVPSDRLQPTLNDLSRLATVRLRNESGNDVTGQFVSARERLTAAKTERKGLLVRLEKAQTDNAARAIRRRLDILAGEIDGLRSQLREVKERTALATVSLELVDKDSEKASPVGSETDQAVDDAVGSLEDILNFLIRALGILMPVGLAGTLGWFAASRARRRARERALA